MKGKHVFISRFGALAIAVLFWLRSRSDKKKVGKVAGRNNSVWQRIQGSFNSHRKNGRRHNLKTKKPSFLQAELPSCFLF